MQNKGLQKSNKLRRVVGLLNYNNYELRFLRNGELDSILLSRLEFELLADNEEAQKTLIKNRGGDSLEDLVAIFRNEEQTTFTIHFNTKKVKVYNFTKPVDDLMFITELDYKKVYSEFLLV